MAEAQRTTEEINVARNKYRTVAARGSVLYFVMASLSRLDPMYQYSLHYFAKQFRHRVAASTTSDDLKKRVEILIEDVTEAM